VSSRTYFWNGFETTLAADFISGATSAQLTSTAGLIAPSYLLFDPDGDSGANREWVRFNDISGDFVVNCVRNQAGSTGDNTHSSGVKVRGVFTKQQLDAIFNDIEAVEDDISTVSDGLTSHEGDTDPHVGYILADGSRAFTGTVDVVTPTVGTEATNKQYVDGLTSSNASAIASNAADITTNANAIDAEVTNRTNADSAHASGVDHPTATTSAKGMMSSNDKQKLDGIESGAEVNDPWTPTYVVNEDSNTTPNVLSVAFEALENVTLSIPGTWGTFDIKVSAMAYASNSSATLAKTFSGKLNINGVDVTNSFNTSLGANDFSSGNSGLLHLSGIRTGLSGTSITATMFGSGSSDVTVQAAHIIIEAYRKT
jgi:hypothetical protein